MSNDTQIVALPDWEHPLVQAAYKILCSDDKPPAGKHWEGFVARRITAAAIALQVEQAGPTEHCGHCNGAGSVTAVTGHLGPDDYEYEAECEACLGTGSPDIRDAINSLPYLQSIGTAGRKMISHAAVLRIIELARPLTASPATPVVKESLPTEPPKAPVEPVEETQDVLIEGFAYTVPMPVAAEMLRLHLEAIDDTERLNWIETAATRRKVEIARSILGAGYEIGEWPSMRVTVKSGTLREAIDAARSTKGTT